MKLSVFPGWQRPNEKKSKINNHGYGYWIWCLVALAEYVIFDLHRFE